MLRDVGGLVHPDVEHAGRDRRVRRGAKQHFGRREHVTADVGHPQRAVPELVEQRGRLRDLARVRVAELMRPDPDAGELHGPGNYRLLNAASTSGPRSPECAAGPTGPPDLRLARSGTAADVD